MADEVLRVKCVTVKYKTNVRRVVEGQKSLISQVFIKFNTISHLKTAKICELNTYSKVNL